MQDVLDGEADCAMDLMGDGAALFGGLGAADFRCDGFEKHRIVETGRV